MSWFQTFLSGFQKVSLSAWLLMAALAIVALCFTVALRKTSNTRYLPVVWGVSLLLMVLTVVFSNPEIELDGPNATQSFLYSPLFWAILLCAGGLWVLFLLLKRQRFTARMLSTGALCVALAFLLSCMTLYRLQNGGSITPASMLPIFVFAYLYGPVPGVAVGVVDGLMQLVQGAYIVHPLQFLLDYILPFAVLGVCGLFRKPKQLPYGIVLGCLLRLAVHLVSGVVFFASYAPDGQSPLVYSLLYNGSYMLPEMIICLGVSLIPQFRASMARLKEQIAVQS